MQKFQLTTTNIGAWLCSKVPEKHEKWTERPKICSGLKRLSIPIETFVRTLCSNPLPLKTFLLF